MALYRKHQNRRKMGRFPLAYMGSTDTTSSAQSFWANRAPTTRDYDGYFIGCLWTDQSTAAVGPPKTDPEVWMLVLKDAQIATWIRFYGAYGLFVGLRGDDGDIAYPAADGVVDVSGGPSILETFGGVFDNELTLNIRNGTNGQIIIAGGTQPEWGNIASSGGTIAISYPGSNQINLEATGVAGLVQLGSDTGVAVPIAGQVNVLGDGLTISTSAPNPGANDLTVECTDAVAVQYDCDNGSAVPVAHVLNINGDVAGNILETYGGSVNPNDIEIEFIDGTVDGQVLISANGAAPNWANILSADGTVVITNGANSIDLSCPGGGVVGPGENINIGAGVTINLNRNIQWPVTNAAGTEGVIYFGATCTGTGPGGSCTGGFRFLHNYSGHPAQPEWSTFLGKNAGNFTNTGYGSTGLGHECCTNITTAHEVTAGGFACGVLITTGSYNTGYGAQNLIACTIGRGNTSVGTNALRHLVDGSWNCAIGWGEAVPVITYGGAGVSYTGTESSNIVICNIGVVGESNTIRIGEHGSADMEQDRCFIAGIRGITTGTADAIPVLIDSSHQLGTVSSSIRYKENVNDIGEESEAIYNLRPVTFNFKSDQTKSKQYGLIAEEVEKVIRRLVVFDPESGQCETVKYLDLIPIMLNEIIKLNKRIEALEGK